MKNQEQRCRPLGVTACSQSLNYEIRNGNNERNMARKR
jgi:hypothetical protein